MNSTEFQVKRGMVFFLNTPSTTQPIKCTSDYLMKKTRPYIVLSNDRCNENSTLIHVAPISTKSKEEAEKRYYTVPFKSAEDRECVVNIADVMLIEKSLCNIDTYAENITRFTRYNKNLMDNIQEALSRHFAFDAREIHPEVIETMNQYPVNNAPIPMQTIVPNITLNISVNGIPIPQNAVSISTEQAIETENNSFENENIDVDVMEETTISNDDKQETEVIAVEIKPVSKETKNNRCNSKKFNLKVGDKFTEEQKQYIENYIIKHSNKFKGKKSVASICNDLNISRGTVNRFVKSILNSNKKFRKSHTHFSLPDSMLKEFVDDQKKFGSRYCLEKYKKYGFTSVKQICDKARLTRIKMAVPNKK